MWPYGFVQAPRRACRSRRLLTRPTKRHQCKRRQWPHTSSSRSSAGSRLAHCIPAPAQTPEAARRPTTTTTTTTTATWRRRRRCRRRRRRRLQGRKEKAPQGEAGGQQQRQQPTRTRHITRHARELQGPCPVQGRRRHIHLALARRQAREHAVVRRRRGQGGPRRLRCRGR